MTTNPTPKDPALKGRRGGNCNREACQRPGATWYNATMNAYYCPSCAERINEVPGYDGKQLCVRCPELEEPASAEPTGAADKSLEIDHQDIARDLLAALIGMREMFAAVGEKINWSKSFLGADEVRLMNEADFAAVQAISKAEGRL